MAIVPPRGLLLYSIGPLEGLFSMESNIRASMEQYAAQTYNNYVAELHRANSYMEFWNSTFNITYALNQGLSFYAQAFNREDLLAISNRIVVCAYMTDDQLLCAHFDLVPESVKVIHYMHVPFTHIKH